MDVRHNESLASSGSCAAYTFTDGDPHARGLSLERTHNQLAFDRCRCRTQEVETGPVDIGKGVEQQRRRVGSVGNEVLLAREQPLELISKARVVRGLV